MIRTQADVSACACRPHPIAHRELLDALLQRGNLPLFILGLACLASTLCGQLADGGLGPLRRVIVAVHDVLKLFDSTALSFFIAL
jgi:hypothetical protein